MRKTKIVCTLGPASESYEIMKKMAIDHGMNVARFNFSHGNHEEHKKRLDTVRKLNKELYVPLAILLDLQGPAIRTGKFEKNVMLEAGEKVIVTTEDIIGTEKRFRIDYKLLPKKVKEGFLIYIADGTIELLVEKIEGENVYCKVIVGGEIGNRKNVNLPGVDVELKSLSEKDLNDITFAIENKVDFIALSFVKSAKDIIELRNILKKGNADIDIVAKIECGQAVRNIDEIIEVADGIMVARGDLGVQIPIEEVPLTQKMIIRKCRAAGKPVITATQMLDSMIRNPRPTRAEATDVANAILDGTDAVILSGETTTGAFPLRAVSMLDKIARQVETILRFKPILPAKPDEIIDVQDTLARAVCTAAHDVNASGIVTCTLSGFTARTVSKYRPDKHIIAVTTDESVVRKLNLVWGARPVLIEMPETTDDLMNYALEAVRDINLLKKGEKIVITAGIPFNISGKTNMMKIETI